MTKHIEPQPGSPNFDGAENRELWGDDLDRAYAKIRELENKLNEDSQAFELECKKAEIALLDRRYEKLLSRWADIQQWYETADRSAHSWVELDKIMENQHD
jgi:hypothetical protein